MCIGLEWELNRNRQQLINNLNGLYADSKDDASIKLAQLSQFYQQHSNLLGGHANGELQSPKQPNSFSYQFNRQLTNGINLNSINNNNSKLNTSLPAQQQQQQQNNLTNNNNSSSNQIKPENEQLILNCSNDSTVRLNNQSINNVSNNSSSSGTSLKSNKSTVTPNPWTEKLKPKCNNNEMQKTDCHLETKELWDKI